MIEDVVDRTFSTIDLNESSHNQAELNADIDEQARHQVIEISVTEQVQIIDAHDWTSDDRFNTPFDAMAALGAGTLNEPVREGLIDACVYVIRNRIEQKLHRKNQLTDSR